MTTPHALSSRRSAFTLVELLTVVGIISLLISIMVPSLARARDVAKKTASLAEIDAVSKGLEVFENEYKYYPASDSGRIDPVSGLPNMVGGDVRLSGAHWLVRAMCGPDIQGMDHEGNFLRDRDQTSVDANGKIIQVQSGGSGITPAAVQAADRKGRYVETNKLLVRDNDVKFAGSPNNPNTGRLVLVDSFGWPIIYYKANPRARDSFCNTNTGHYGPTGTDPLGIYNQNDNAMITGTVGTGGGGTPTPSWDFATTGQRHGLAFFGPPQRTIVSTPDMVEKTPLPSADFKGKNFVDYLHEHKTHETGGVIKPVNPESFVLISAGKDGIFGTEDDPTNFNK